MITTIDIDGEPWMVCDPENQAEVQDVISKSNLPGTITSRPATARESAKLQAEKIITAKRGDDPDKLFGVSI